MSDIKQRVQRQFGDHAQNYVESPNHAKGASLERLLALTAPHENWRVLDIATGGGHTALNFAGKVGQVVATDLTYRMLTTARTHLRENLPDTMRAVDFACCDAENLPFAAESFDLVTCRIAPHHFPNVAQFVGECARVLRGGGHLAIVDIVVPPQEKAARYINAFERLRDPSHAWAYSVVAWHDFFKQAGLVLQHEEKVENRKHLSQWTARLSCPPLVVEQLKVLLIHAPELVKKWLAPEFPLEGSGESIRFTIRHALMIAQKEDTA